MHPHTTGGDDPKTDSSLAALEWEIGGIMNLYGQKKKKKNPTGEV